MKLMLDTNVCIYLIKERPVSVLERFASHPVGEQPSKLRTALEKKGRV